MGHISPVPVRCLTYSPCPMFIPLFPSFIIRPIDSVSPFLAPHTSPPFTWFPAFNIFPDGCPDVLEGGVQHMSLFMCQMQRIDSLSQWTLPYHFFGVSALPFLHTACPALHRMPPESHPIILPAGIIPTSMLSFRLSGWNTNKSRLYQILINSFITILFPSSWRVNGTLVSVKLCFIHLARLIGQ